MLYWHEGQENFKYTNEKAGSWHIGESCPDIQASVATFQADGDELRFILDAIGSRLVRPEQKKIDWTLPESYPFPTCLTGSHFFGTSTEKFESDWDFFTEFSGSKMLWFGSQGWKIVTSLYKDSQTRYVFLSPDRKVHMQLVKSAALKNVAQNRMLNLGLIPNKETMSPGEIMELWEIFY